LRGVNPRRYVVASVIALAGFGALFMALPSQGAGLKVRLVGMTYRPSSFTIHAGGAVTFENDSRLTHTATCTKCGLDTGDIQPRTLKTLTFGKPGTYQLFCRYHGEQGMVATVIVKP
jgi:plastocyanin